GIEQLQPMPNRRDADLLQRVVGEARKNRFVYLVLAEGRLVTFEAEAPQPASEVHDTPSRLSHIIVPPRERVQDGANGSVGSQGFARRVGSSASPGFTPSF